MSTKIKAKKSISVLKKPRILGRKATGARKKFSAGCEGQAVKTKPLLEASDIGVAPQHVLSVASGIDHIYGEQSVFRRPLASHRVSFWLGVGFGILIIGVLVILAWQILRIELAEAIVIGSMK